MHVNTCVLCVVGMYDQDRYMIIVCTPAVYIPPTPKLTHMSTVSAQVPKVKWAERGESHCTCHHNP